MLEAGAGPGRFTLELAEIGARVVVGDISPGQLALHREKTASVEASVERRLVLDIVDLGAFRDGEFDAVVCYGGPLSYVLGEADRALAELLRVTRPGGIVLLSVMSLLGGSLRVFFDYLPGLVEEFGWQRAVADVLATGDLPADLNRGHVCRLYRWSDLQELLGRHPCRVAAASAANFISVNEAWDDRFLEIELAACREPGVLDGGTHILAVVERL